MIILQRYILPRSHHLKAADHTGDLIGKEVKTDANVSKIFPGAKIRKDQCLKSVLSNIRWSGHPSTTIDPYNAIR